MIGAMIKPSIGRVVWYHPAGPIVPAGAQPLAALVTYVHSDTCVNLAVFDSNGVASSQTSVFLDQGDGGAVPDSGYCEWMPYQIGQAAKAQNLEQQLDELATKS
jgi:hypothetical protein